MANVKISQLPSLSTMTDASEIPVVSSGTTYKITGSTLEVYFTGNVEFSGTAMSPRAGATESNITLQNGTSAVDILAANGWLGNTNFGRRFQHRTSLVRRLRLVSRIRL